MCKLLIITGVTEPILTGQFMDKMAIPMSKSNRNGIGYAAVKANGDIFSEKWKDNYNYMDPESIMTPEIARRLKKYERRLPFGALDTNYMSYGNIDYTDVTSIMLHTRMATCEVNIQNTHPFIDADTALIHNGVIRNADVLKVNKLSTCDSEAALQTYIQQGVARDPSKAKQWLDMLTGGYAFGIFGRDADGNRILDVVRGSSFLYYMEIEGVGKVHTTDKDDAIEVCKAMNLKFIKEPYLMEYDTMHRYNAITGEYLQNIVVKTPYVQQDYSNYHWNRSTGSHSGRSGSSSSKPSNKSTTESTTQQINKTSTPKPTEKDREDYEELIDRKGNWDRHKVAEYCSNIMEPITDRLYLFDLVYSTDYASRFEEILNPEFRDSVEQTDLMEGFRAARQHIKELSKYLLESASNQ